MVISALLASLFMAGTLLWGVRFRNGRYAVLISASVIVKGLLIYLDENYVIFPRLGYSEYIPYFERFIEAGFPVSWLFSGRVPTYTVLFPGWVYPVIGPGNEWVIRVGNAMIATWTLWPAVYLYETLAKSTKRNTMLALLVLFWPSWLRYSIGIGRTSVSVFFVVACVAVIAHVVMRTIRNVSPLWVISVIFFTLIAILLRPAHIAFPMALLVSVVFLNRRSIPFKLGYALIFAMLLLAIIPVYNDMAGSQQADLEMIAERARTDVRGATSYLQRVSPQNWWDWTWYLPLHGFYFLFAPLPWHAVAANNPLAWGSALQSIFLFVALLFAILSRKRYFIDSSKKVLLMTILICSMLMGSGVKNAGSAERWSMPITILVFVVVSSTVFHKVRFVGRKTPDFRRSVQKTGMVPDPERSRL